jgi:diketogulonate reductase-like aldo/keto reductase
METKTLKDGSHIPALGFGTWEMGGRMTKDDTEDDKYINAIQNAVATGFRHIDTAEMYGNGHTETLVGKAIEGTERSSLYLTSKVRKENLAYADVIKACENSLRRLGTDYLDLYLIHHPNPSIPVKATVKALDELVEKGYIRRYGLSNFNIQQTAEALQHARHPVVVNQIEYNLHTRNKGAFNINMEKEIIPYCLENDILVMAWRPLVKGSLQADNPVLKQLAEKYRRTPNQIAINWLLSKRGFATIVKATSKNHIEENYAAADFSLTPADMKVLDYLSHTINDEQT